MGERPSGPWNLAAPPGFRGFDDRRGVTIYRRRLPHWRQDGATYFVTFRLADSLPEFRLRELDALQADLDRRYPPPRTQQAWEQIVRARAERVERWLDELHGSCLLAKPQFASHLTEAMHHFDGDRYVLGSYVVMPNHAHALVRPLAPPRFPLEKIVGGWKQHSALEIGKMTGGAGRLWQDESHDRIIRDEEHLYRALQYIGRNPGKSVRSLEECPRWVRPEWETLGWRFEAA